MSLNIPRINIYSIPTKEETVVKNDDGTYSKVVTLTDAIKKDDVLDAVAKLEAQIADIKEKYADAFTEEI